MKKHMRWICSCRESGGWFSSRLRQRCEERAVAIAVDLSLEFGARNHEATKTLP